MDSNPCTSRSGMERLVNESLLYSELFCCCYVPLIIMLLSAQVLFSDVRINVNKELYKGVEGRGFACFRLHRSICFRD